MSLMLSNMILGRENVIRKMIVGYLQVLGIITLFVSCAVKDGMTREEYHEAVKERVANRDFAVWIDLNVYNGRQNGPSLNDFLSTSLVLKVAGDSVYSTLPPDFFVFGREFSNAPVVTGRIENYRQRELGGGRTEVLFSFVPCDGTTGKELGGEGGTAEPLDYRLVFGPWDYVGVRLHNQFFNGRLYEERHVDATISTLNGEEMLKYLRESGLMEWE